MLPCSELDNYKLQVELLQEKLKRSEENRKRLEHKLDHAIQKKTEQEKIVRAKQREKYHDFLGELEKRNERNRQLMKMLERVDQQTAALSARSERLRMMKMQYEMYFAKLVQTQTMRCIQATTPTAATPATFLTTAPTPIPILLPTTPPTQQHQQSNVMTPAPIKNNEHEPLTSACTTTAPTTTAIYQCDASGNLIAAGTASVPTTHMTTPRSHIENASSCNTITAQPSATLPAALAASAQHWTLALATPTPAGMLLTNNNPAVPTANLASAMAAAPTFDYMQYPLGYLPRMRHLLQQKPNMSIYSDESDDLLPPMRANTKSDRFYRHRRSNMDNDNDMNTYDDETTNVGIGETREIGAPNRMDLPTRQLDNDKISEVKAAVEAERTQTPHRNNERQQAAELLLSGMSPTSSASLLTLDKLPKTMTMTEHDDSALASTPIDDRNNDVDDGSGNGNDNNGRSSSSSSNNGDKARMATRFDEFSKGISMIGGVDKGALPIQRNEEEKSTAAPTATNTTTTTTVISNDNGSFIEANLRQKIDMPKPWQQQHMTQSWEQSENTANSKETTSGGKDNTSKFDEMTAGFTEYAKNSTSNNSGSKSTDGGGGGIGGADDADTNTTKMTIEKIENEIYGELVNPPTSEVDNTIARNAAQGLVSELVTQQQHQQQQQSQQNNQEIYDANADNTNYAFESNSESYDPTYATIEGTTNAEVYPMPGNENAAEYAQYATDADAMQQQHQQEQQDYANLDYANYDASQYAADGTYDPNIYPGYTYDATTGQYTPDQQYLGTDGTGGYAEQAVYDQQQYDTSQQEQQNYDYGNYEQATESTANMAYNESDAAAVAAAATSAEQSPQSEAQFAPSNPELPDTTQTPTMSANKPTSILSSGDKHAANEAQKKKKRVNFVDSSETDDSSSVKQTGPSGSASGGANESDFDFSSSDKSGAGSSSGAT